MDTGILTRPSTIGRHGIFFCPQRSYITKGTLRQQVPSAHNHLICCDTYMYVMILL
jgi:ABC-type uncharacterized transport system fused permease/ATPase subunit